MGWWTLYLWQRDAWYRHPAPRWGLGGGGGSDRASCSDMTCGATCSPLQLRNGDGGLDRAL